MYIPRHRSPSRLGRIKHSGSKPWEWLSILPVLTMTNIFKHVELKQCIMDAERDTFV